MCAPALSTTVQSTDLSRHRSAQPREPSSPGIAESQNRRSANIPLPNNPFFNPSPRPIPDEGSPRKATAKNHTNLPPKSPHP